jgi:NADH-quinone oxidoreductase subunit G
MDMGLLPDLGPGYKPVQNPGLALPEMMAATDLDVLWVVGANPLARYQLAGKPFLVVQEMFLTETAKLADIILPAANAYEKNGTVTNGAGEVQRLHAAGHTMGAKPDLEIIGLIAKEMKLNLGIWTHSNVFDEIRKQVSGYNIPLPIIATGQAVQTSPLNGRVPVASRPDLIQSAGNTLFTSGSLGRYSKKLNSVVEHPGQLYRP